MALLMSRHPWGGDVQAGERTMVVYFFCFIFSNDFPA